jgi:hypothetical protein
MKATTREQYTKAWMAHINALDVALCWDLMDVQTAAESAELQNALKTYRKFIEKAARENFPGVTEDDVRAIMAKRGSLDLDV